MRHAWTGSSSPVCQGGGDEFYADEHDCWAGDERWKKLLQHPRRHKTQGNFKQRTQRCRSKNSSIALRARQSHPISICWAKSGSIHLTEPPHSDRDGGEGCADDGEEAGAEVVGRAFDVETGDLDAGEEARDN